MTSSLERAIQESKEREENRVENTLSYVNGRSKWEPKWREMVEWIVARRKKVCWCSLSAQCDWCYLVSELERLAKEGLGEK